MVDETQEQKQEQSNEEMSDEEALMKLASVMKENAPSIDEKQNVHTFLFSVVSAKDTTKIGNLGTDKEMNELGNPQYNVRGAKEMSLIADKIMGNTYFKEYFDIDAENTLATSLSKDGFLVKQGTTQTKQVADITRRRKINKGWFGKQSVEEQGGDK